MALYNNKYRIESARLKNWDYGNNGYYFITICTRNREHFFCNSNSIRNLNEAGITATNVWHEIPEFFPYAQTDAFIVMPNHIHGIIIIDKNNYISENTLNTDISGGITSVNNPMLTENLSRIIRWYKGRTTFEIRMANINFGWQPRFHDHVIRNNDSYVHISNYIISNPEKWQEDTFFS